MRAIVTGAASGIGAAVAELLVARGWQVACLDRAPARCGLPILVDVADEDSVQAAVSQAADRMGGLDALATCAGVIDSAPLHEITVASLRRLHDVNVIGTFLCAREAARRMAPGGRICTVASIAGLRGGGLVGNTAYAASKGAVLALSKSLARELGPAGIAVNCMAPGLTETPMTAAALADPQQREALHGLPALGRAAGPHEIAEAIAWLLSPAASFVNGATLVADGGLAMH